MNIHVVVLAGGAGTRFWPAGRKARPKQLLPITGERTMLAETLGRCSDLAPPERWWIVTNEVQVEATRRECPQVPSAQVIPEPLMRNTAAAIGLAAMLIREQDPEGVMIVMPADHAIRPVELFVRTFRAAAERAVAAGTLLTVGVRPTGPATGYGYIEGGDEILRIDDMPVHAVQSFKEKPDAATAAEFIRSGRYFWNSGTFVWTVGALLAAMAEHLPGHIAVLESILRTVRAGGTITAEEYGRFEKVPIDIGVMERARNVEVIPATFEWDDVGSWLALTRLHGRDDQGNVVRAEHVGVDTRNSIVVGKPGHVIATLGIEGLIVVHTPDATLVARKDRAEDVKKLVEKLRETGRERYL